MNVNAHQGALASAFMVHLGYVQLFLFLQGTNRPELELMMMLKVKPISWKMGGTTQEMKCFLEEIDDEPGFA